MKLQIIRIKDEKSLVLQNTETGIYCSVTLSNITPEFRKKCMQVKTLLGTELSTSNGVMMKINDDDITVNETENKNGEKGKIYNIKNIESLSFVEQALPILFLIFLLIYTTHK